MTTSQLRFPDYGDDGDVAGAHRARWAFRLSVLALMLLTFFAWLTENYLNYNAAERNFRSGITQKRDAARVFLQAAVKLDAGTATTPTSKYTQALAVREEDDVALSTFERAFEMDPNSSFFTIRYGCRLYLLGRPGDALEKFRHARNLPPANALPRYLEAAAAARADRSPKGLSDAIVLLSRANNTRDPLVFPKPIWFSGFPQTGTQYAALSREIYTEACAPLYTLVQQALDAVEKDGEMLAGQDAKTWLNQIVTMGERLVKDSDPNGSLQAIAGVSFQLRALALLEKLPAVPGGENADVLTPMIEKRLKLEQAMDLLNTFENQRPAQVGGIEQEFLRPLKLTFLTILFLVIAYLLARGIHGLLRYRKTAWALPHSFFGKVVLGAGVGGYLVLLIMMAILQRSPLDQQWYLGALSTAWWGITAVLIGFGLIYPGLRLASPEDVSKKSGRLEDMPEVMRLARQAYRRVYAAFVVRYYGILCGIYFCMICLWILGYRVVNGLYPMQINLLANGLIRQEQEVVRSVIALLS